MGPVWRWSSAERLLGGLDERQHRLDEGGLGLGIASRVVLRLGDLDHLDDAVDDVHRGALAAHRVRTKHASGARVRREHNVERDGERRLRVGDKLDQVRAREALVLLPARHDRAVVDAVDIDLVDPSVLKLALNLGFLEARDLARGSGGGEGAGERHPKGVSLGEVTGHLLVRRVEAEEADVDRNVGERVPNLRVGAQLVRHGFAALLGSRATPHRSLTHAFHARQ